MLHLLLAGRPPGDAAGGTAAWRGSELPALGSTVAWQVPVRSACCALAGILRFAVVLLLVALTVMMSASDLSSSLSSSNTTSVTRRAMGARAGSCVPAKMVLFESAQRSIDEQRPRAECSAKASRAFDQMVELRAPRPALLLLDTTVSVS